MKKVLCGIVCVAAGAALAVDPVTVSTIEVRAVDSGLTNTIVAIPGLDLAGGPLVISNLVKTTNLAAGDMLYAFSNGEYETWTLVNSAGGKYWDKASLKCTIDAEGKATEKAGVSASSYTMSVGSGIWLSRKASGSTGAFYVYAQQPESTSTTVGAGATALVGNPTQTDKAPSIPTPSVGDQVIIPTAGLPITYTYRNGAWGYMQNSELHTGLPSIAAGTGFWYVSKGASDVTITW